MVSVPRSPEGEDRAGRGHERVMRADLLLKVLVNSRLQVNLCFDMDTDPAAGARSYADGMLKRNVAPSPGVDSAAQARVFPGVSRPPA